MRGKVLTEYRIHHPITLPACARWPGRSRERKPPAPQLPPEPALRDSAGWRNLRGMEEPRLSKDSQEPEALPARPAKDLLGPP